MEKVATWFNGFWSKAKEKSYTAYFLGLISALIVCAVYYLLAVGPSGLADFLTEIAIFGSASCVFIDVYLKAMRNPVAICKEYWLVVATALLTDGALVWAFSRGTKQLQFIGLGITVALALLTGVLAHWVYKPKAEAKKEDAIQTFISYLVKNKGFTVANAEYVARGNWMKDASLIEEVEVPQKQGISGEVR